ncbi:MAG TPA: hypothetical protein VGE92_00940 [Steroidobacteraceae bacterium]|jgi:hypothetical protein
MYLRKIVLIGACAAVLAPAISNASPERTALNACVRAFATSLATPGNAAPAVKVDYRGDITSGSVLDYFASEYTFDLHANNGKTGLAVGHVSCTSDTRGAVISMSQVARAAKN